MQFEISTTNFKASGEITNGQVKYSIRARGQSARMVFKLKQLKKDQLNGTGSLDTVRDTLQNYEAQASQLDAMRTPVAS